jgi:hypothetical protein
LRSNVEHRRNLLRLAIHQRSAQKLFRPEAAAGTNILERWFRSVLAGVMLAALHVFGKSMAAGTFGARRR